MPELRTVGGRRVAVAFVALVAGAVAVARAAEVPAEPVAARLQVTAEPAVLTPEVRAVVLRVDGCGEAPVLAASAGAVSGVRALGGGRATARYVPPDEARPQVAIVTAACGGRRGWTPLPIVGRGVAIARTTPLASVRVTIGARSFGPVVADAEGVARVPVEVPPGVRVAYQGERALDLGVPPSPRVHLALDPPIVRADRAAEIAVRAHVVTEAGERRAGAPVRLVAAEGAVSDAIEVEPGLLVARWSLPPGRAGAVRLEATLADGEAGTGHTVALERRAGPPARVEVSTDRPTAVAGEAPVQLDVRVLDAAGNPTAAALRVDPPGAALDSREVAPGRFAVRLGVPERLDGRAALDVTLTAGDVGASVRVPLSAAPAATLSVDSPARELVANGRAALDVRVALRDRFGNPAVDPPSVETAGSAEVSTERDGEDFRVTVRPRRRLVASEDALTIAGAGRTERLALVLRPADPLVALAARLGYLASAGGLRSAYAGLEAGVWPVSWRRFGVAVEAGLFAHDRTDLVADAGGPVEVRGEVRYLPIAASARWRRAPSPRTELVAAVGAVVAPLSAEVRVTGQPSERENGVAPGAQVAFGAGRRLGAGVLFLEARGLWLADPGLDVVHGQVLATGLVAGWAHGLF